MPDMDGRDLAGRILSASPQVKCLFFSGYSGDSGDSAGLRSATRDGLPFLQKPFSLDDLATAVRGVLDSATGQGIGS